MIVKAAISILLTVTLALLFLIYLYYGRLTLEFLVDISPYIWSSIGIAMAFGLSILGAAWYKQHCFNVLGESY